MKQISFYEVHGDIADIERAIQKLILDIRDIRKTILDSDLAPVIRCADCISATYNDARDIIWCDYHREYLTPANYCSLAVRKKGDEDNE